MALVGKQESALYGSYSDDYDIFDATDRVINILRRKAEKNALIEKQIQELRVKLLAAKSPGEQKRIDTQISDLLLKCQGYGNAVDFSQKVKPILDKYREIGGPKTCVVLWGAKKETEPSDIVREHLIRLFFSVVQSYQIPVNVTREQNQESQCESCGSSHELYAIENFGCHICSSCGHEKPSFRNKSSNSSLYVSMSDDLKNFRDALKRHQGTQKIKFDINIVMKKLDEYFASRKKPLGEQIRSGKFPCPSMTEMIDALSYVNCSSLYEHRLYIANIYWGRELPNIKHIEEQLIRDYLNTQKIYSSIKSKFKKKSSINIEVRLYLHVKTRTDDVNLENYKLVSTPETHRSYVEIWQEISNEMMKIDKTWRHVELPPVE